MSFWLLALSAIFVSILGWSIAGLKLRYELPGRILFGAIIPAIATSTVFILFNFGFINGPELDGEDLGMRYAFGGLAWVYGSFQLMIPAAATVSTLEYLFAKRVE